MSKGHSDINWLDKDGNTHLHLSVKRDDEESVRRYLLELESGTINAENHNEETPISYANFKNPRMVKLLLDAGATIHAPNNANFNRTPLIMAVLAGNLESVNLLLGAEYSPSIEHEDAQELTALDYAVDSGSIEMTQAILQHVAQSNNIDYFVE